MAAADTQRTLASGSFLGIINVLMQLRKVCNHPDLFEGRPIVSSFDLPPLHVHLPSLLLRWHPHGGSWGLGAWAVAAGW